MRKHMNKPVLLLTLSLLASCSSVPLTTEARRVREIQPDWANSCKLITTEEVNNTSFGAHPGICAQRAQDSMRNRVAELGGNAYVVTYRSVSLCLVGGTTISFEAYKCPER
jgi:hypothetical protein